MRNCDRRSAGLRCRSCAASMRSAAPRFIKWRARYGGMDASMMSQMKALEDENRRL